MSFKAMLEALLIETQRETAIREAQIRQALVALAAAEEAEAARAAQAAKAQGLVTAAEEAEIAQAVASVAEFLQPDDDFEWRALVESLAVSYLPPYRPPPLAQL